MAEKVTSEREEGTERSRQGNGPRPSLLTPLVIGGIAYGLLLIMVVIVLLLVAWRLGGG